jgi:hypothetical protein
VVYSLLIASDEAVSMNQASCDTINEHIDNLNTTQTLEYTKDKYNVKINKWKGLS